MTPGTIAAISTAIGAAFILAASLIIRHPHTADPTPGGCICGDPTAQRIIHRPDMCAFIDCPLCDSTGIVTTSEPLMVCWCANGDAAITRTPQLATAPRAPRPQHTQNTA